MDGDEDFLAEARRRRRGMLAELGAFLLTNKRYWLLPIVVVMIGFAALVVLSGTGAAPFIYTLF